MEQKPKNQNENGSQKGCLLDAKMAEENVKACEKNRIF
jgi:hypothetical protein